MVKKLIQSIIGSELRNKFILFFIILAGAPVLILGGTALYLIDLSHRNDVANLELQLIDQKTEELKKFFADTLGILELRVGYTQRSEIDLKEQKFIVDGLLGENHAFEEVSLINLQGIETAKKDRTEGMPELLDISRLLKFKTAIEGKNYISEVHYTPAGPLITLASPVRNRNGDIIQVLSAEVNLQQVIRSIENAHLGSSGYLVLLDKDGALIARQGSLKVGVGVDVSGLERVKRLQRGEVLNALDPHDRYESFFSSVPVVGAGKKIADFGWMLIAEWPLVDADAIIQDVRKQVVQLTFLSIMAVLLLAPFFVRRLLKPIEDLKIGVHEIERGNFEKRVSIRTKDELEDLGNAFNQMAQGLKRLQELKNEFVFIAAHELRSPVTAIKGYLSIFREEVAGTLNQEFKRYLESMWQANERLVQLINDILEIARSEAKKLEVKVVPHDINESVRAIVEESQSLASQKNIILSYNTPETMPNVLADPIRVKEIIANFVSNAIKYTPNGGSIKIYHEINSGSIITHVEDTGFGIPQAEQKHIFEKFFRSENEKMRVIIGTGLGLFIAKELAEKMGGKMWFRSEEGKGSRFSFSMPIVS